MPRAQRRHPRRRQGRVQRRIEVVGLEDSFDGLLDPSRTRLLTPKDVTGILRLGGTILGTTNRGNPFEYPVDALEGQADYSGPRGRDVPQDGAGRAGRHRRRRHAADRASVLPEGHSRRRRAEDHRQRHLGHDQLFRLRHGRVVCGRCHRSAAHDGGSASTHHGRRGDGPLRRLDRAACRRRRRRRRHPDSGDSLRPRQGRRATSASARASARGSASSSWPKGAKPVGGDVDAARAAPGRARRAARRRRRAWSRRRWRR